MKIEIENLKAQMTGIELNIYQKADALIEFNKLLDYVNKLEQLTIPRVVGTCCDDNELDCPYEFTSRCTMGRCGCKPKAN